MTALSSNRDLAQAARERARHHPGGSLHRRSLLVVAVAFHETTTPEAAHQLLRKEHIPEQVRERAHALLDELTKEGTHQ